MGDENTVALLLRLCLLRDPMRKSRSCQIHRGEKGKEGGIKVCFAPRDKRIKRWKGFGTCLSFPMNHLAEISPGRLALRIFSSV